MSGGGDAYADLAAAKAQLAAEKHHMVEGVEGKASYAAEKTRDLAYVLLGLSIMIAIARVWIGWNMLLVPLPVVATWILIKRWRSKKLMQKQYEEFEMQRTFGVEPNSSSSSGSSRGSFGGSKKRNE
ncbi:MAG: hypothetical protein WBD01_15620 [Salaquimonas sp.]